MGVVETGALIGKYRQIIAGNTAKPNVPQTQQAKADQNIFAKPPTTSK